MRYQAVSAICVALLLPLFANAQTNTEDFAQFKFNFNNPGARATGIGGAFISIADDATAAEANPAGLTVLIRPELSFELKGSQFTKTANNFSQVGNASNFTLKSKDFNSSVISPSFASIVYPFTDINLTVSAFRYELVNYESKFYTEGAYVPPPPATFFFFPVRSEFNLKVVNWGAAFGYKVNEWLSVGISSGISTIDADTKLNRYNLAIFNDEFIANTARINDSQTDFFVNVGVIVKPMDNLSIGGIYKRRPQYDLKHTFSFTRAFAATDSFQTRNVHFNIPSSFGFGISYRPTDVLTLAFDIVRIQYSSLADDLVITQGLNSYSSKDFKTEDGMEYHVGAEYVWLLQSVGFVFRGGLYVEPDHRIKWVGVIDDMPTLPPGQRLARMNARRSEATLFVAGDNDVHYTFGLGVLLSNNFQVDLAGNVSDTSQEFVGSFVVRL